jgi:2-dehydropantoate 2-reductase
VIGGGGIGGYFAALLHAAGADVTLCVRTPAEELRVERHGTITTLPVRIVSATADAGPTADWVVVAVKGQDTAGTQAWLDVLAGPQTTVVVAQNGVDHVERVQPLVPASTVLPILVYFTIEPLGPGHIKHSVGNRLVVPAGAAGDAFVALLEGSGLDIDFTEDFTTAAWRKFLGNVFANPITALTLRRSDVFTADGMDELGRELVSEAIAVGTAEGARFADGELEATLEVFRNVPKTNGTSMLFDRLAGRPLEHELITGVVASAGSRHGIPTPANDVLLTLLRALGPLPS